MSKSLLCLLYALLAVPSSTLSLTCAPPWVGWNLKKVHVNILELVIVSTLVQISANHLVGILGNHVYVGNFDETLQFGPAGLQQAAHAAGLAPHIHKAGQLVPPRR